MRTTRKGLEFGIKLINRALGMKEEHSTRDTNGKYRANVGTFGMEVQSPGDGVTRYQLSRNINEAGGITIIGNRTLLGASAFEDYLRGVLEGIRLVQEDERVSESDYMLARTIELLCNGPNGSETKHNPYGVKPIHDALLYLANKYGVTDTLDAAKVLVSKYQPK